MSTVQATPGSAGCTGGCANGMGASSDQGNQGCPYQYSDGEFTIDTSAVGVMMTDDQGNDSLAALLLKEGAIVQLFGFTVPGTGTDPDTGASVPITVGVNVVLPVLQTITSVTVDGTGKLTGLGVSIQPTPTQANLIPGSSSLTAVSPNTNGVGHNYLIFGAGLPDGSTCSPIDSQTLGLGNTDLTVQAVVGGDSPSYSGITVTPPVAIPDSGHLNFSPCVFPTPTFSGGAGAFRSCGNAKEAFSQGSITLPPGIDVSDEFSNITFSVDVDMTLEITSSFTSAESSPGFLTSSTETSTFELDHFSGNVSGSASSAGTSSPVNTTTPPIGQFRVYKCGGCCDACFYIFVFNALTDPSQEQTNPITGAKIPDPNTDQWGGTGTGTLSGNYTETKSTSYTETTTDVNGNPVTYTGSSNTNTTSTQSGTIDLTGFGILYDYGLACFALGQSQSNPSQGYGFGGAFLSEKSRSVVASSETNSTADDNGTTTSSSSSGTGYSGQGLGTLGGGMGAQYFSCDPSGGISASGTTVVETTTVYTGTKRIITVTTTIDSAPPTITTSTLDSTNAPGTITNTLTTITSMSIGAS